MRMDIASPVELMMIEQADFGDGRRQAYLTFLNESPYVITALSGRVTLMDETGAVIEDRRTGFGKLAAPPGRRFTCHLSLDDAPDFVSATMLIEDVLFDGVEPWALHPLRVKDYEPDLLPDGPERAALIAVAGEDAVCYPAQGDGTWTCVCGRFNRLRWSFCRRCRRDRDEVLERFTPERVRADHQARIAQAQRKPPRMIVDGAAAKQQRATRERKPRPPASEEGWLHWLAEHWPLLLAIVVVSALLIWGVITLASRMPGLSPYSPTSTSDVTRAPAFEPDYLDPL